MISSDAPRLNGIRFDSPMIAADLENSIISKNSKSSAGQSFMKDLDKLNEQQTFMVAKLAKEKKRKAKLEEEIEVPIFLLFLCVYQLLCFKALITKHIDNIVL